MQSPRKSIGPETQATDLYRLVEDNFNQLERVSGTNANSVIDRRNSCYLEIQLAQVCFRRRL